ncbi:MAG: response regulator [Planctomycetota bacterium]|nr:response regulator [Planctomycetota bacterium]
MPLGPSVLKQLSRETKALIIVSEFEARRMAMYQLRQVLEEIITDETEKKVIIELVENDLKASGYQKEQIEAFLADLLVASPKAAPSPAEVLRSTRQVRNPFAFGFEPVVPPGEPGGSGPAQPAPSLPPRTFPGTPIVSRQAPYPAAPVPPSSGVPQPYPGVSPAAQPTEPPVPSGQTAIPDQAPAAIKPVRPPSGPAVDVRRTQIVPPPTSPLYAGHTRTVAPPAKDQVFFGGKAGGIRAEAIQRPTVLIADDDKRIRMVFKLRLEEAGFAVIEAEDGAEAWRCISEGKASLAVLDMKMPGLHGLEVLSRMADKQIRIPVIVCSAYDQLKDEFLVATHPRLRFFVKPVGADAIVAAARELLGQQ